MEGLDKDTILILEMIKARQENAELFHELLFKSITSHLTSRFSLDDTQDIINGINALVKYFEAKEDYLKCHLIHKVGYAIFNHIE